jgi:hypothetical protein
MATRHHLSPGALYLVLNTEWKKLQPLECGVCQMPLPYPIEHPDEVSANWRIGTPAACGYGCDVIIVEIAARMWPLYDLVDPFSETVAISPKRT